MTKKRYNKLMMSRGYSRNELSRVSESMVPFYKTYSDFYEEETHPYLVRFENAMYTIIFSTPEDQVNELLKNLATTDQEKEMLQFIVGKVNRWMDKQVEMFRDVARARIRNFTPQERSMICTSYCANDLEATEDVFEDRKGGFDIK